VATTGSLSGLTQNRTVLVERLGASVRGARPRTDAPQVSITSCR